ncbi:MAG: ornithine carbamoyltransferase [Elusimicrobia bacterium]|nr:ornithine carbamoyltransferase [Elusimicrobiota bacterium]
MKKKDFIALTDHDLETLDGLVRRGIELKKGAAPSIGPGKVLALIFNKPSTRTNVSFQMAINRLGGSSIYLGAESLQLSRGETIEDTARTLSRYVDAVMIRTYSHQSVIDFAGAASIPVINGLTDLLHPCQALGDIMSVAEVKGRDYKNIKMAYIGDGNNVCHSLINAAGIFGFGLAVSGPPDFPPDPGILKKMKEINGRITVTEDPYKAVKDADAVYTDVWVSMGDKQGKADSKKAFEKYQVNEDLIKNARPDAIVMHCLPAHRGEEITDSVMDGPQSYVFEQAENRMHIQEAILEYLLKGCTV